MLTGLFVGYGSNCDKISLSSLPDMGHPILWSLDGVTALESGVVRLIRIKWDLRLSGQVVHRTGPDGYDQNVDGPFEAGA